MNLQVLVALAEIVSAFAVVLTLVVLIISFHCHQQQHMD
jgi:hypothetical protein